MGCSAYKTYISLNSKYKITTKGLNSLSKKRIKMENLAQKKTKGKNMQPKNKVVTINYKSKLFDDGVSECKFQNEEEVILFLLPSGMGNPQFRELEKNYYKMNLGGGYQTAEEYMKSEGVSRTSLTQRIKLNKVTTCKAGQYVFIKNK